LKTMLTSTWRAANSPYN